MKIKIRLQTIHWPLVIILGLGLGLRLIWLWLQYQRPLWLDEPEYLQTAQSLWQGQYIDNGRWLRPPLFPIWLALTAGPTGNRLTAHVAQIFLSTAVVYLLYRIALAAWNRQDIALVCALIASIYLPLIAYASYLMADTLLLILLCGLLLALIELRRRPSTKMAIFVGCLLGLSALTKPIALTCIPVSLIIAWCSTNTWKRSVIRVGLVLLCCVIVIMPWSLRNIFVYHHLVLLDTTGGYNLWIGNLPPNGDRQFLLENNDIHTEVYIKDATFALRARENILQNPGYTIAQIGRKIIQFWRTDADLIASHQYGELALTCPDADISKEYGILSPESAAKVMDNTRSCNAILINLASDIVYLPILLGVLIAAIWLPKIDFTLISLGWLLPMYGVMILTIVQPRLRLSIFPVLLPYGAAGLTYSGYKFKKLITFRAYRSYFSKSFTWHHGVTLAAITVGAWLLNIIPLAGSEAWMRLGNYSWSRNNPEQALQYYRLGSYWYPTRISNLVVAGSAAEMLGKIDEALDFYHSATAIVPFETQARVGAARIYAFRGASAAAAAEIKRSLSSQSIIEATTFIAPILPSKDSIDIGRNPIEEYGYTLGMYPAELPGSVSSFRWTSTEAQLRFGTLPTTTTLLSLRLNGERPAGAPEAKVEIRINDQMTAQFVAQPGWHIYHFIVPPTQHGIRMILRTSTFIPADYSTQTAAMANTSSAPVHTDPRRLGIALDWARVNPMN